MLYEMSHFRLSDRKEVWHEVYSADDSHVYPGVQFHPVYHTQSVG